MFDLISSQFWVVLSSVFAICMGIFVMLMRLRAQKKPTSAKRIMIPPLAMSTGALMFIFEPFRVSLLEILEVASLGIIFSAILIATSKFEVQGKEIYLKASKAFPFILIGLLIFRIILKMVLANTIDIGELGGMFFLLAFFMLLPWRLAMLYKFTKLKSQMNE